MHFVVVVVSVVVVVAVVVVVVVVVVRLTSVHILIVFSVRLQVVY